MPALAAIEAVPTDPKDKPREEIVLVKATVFSNPITEMEDALEQELQVKIDEREVSGSLFMLMLLPARLIPHAAVTACRLTTLILAVD